MKGRIVSGPIRAIFFDAVGTLLHPDPSAGQVYAEVGRAFGSRLKAEEIRARFAWAFAEEEKQDARQGYRTDEERERARWQGIVGRVLDDVADLTSCFEALYRHFREPSSWRVETNTEQVLLALSRAGIRLGMASNFDHRLREVVAGRPELWPLQHLLISSEVGWKKPAVAFFDRLVDEVEVDASEILFVGDDLENDFEGARKAGLRALLFDPKRSASLASEHCLHSLLDLLSCVER